MGVKIEVGKDENSLREILIQDYSVKESSTPLSGGDSSGAIGTIDLTIASDSVLPNPSISIGDLVRVTDTAKGYTFGTVQAVDHDRATDLVSVTADLPLGRFVTNVSIDAFVGTVKQAFERFCNIAGIVGDVFVDSTISQQLVAIPGFYGDLWTHMKEFATSIGADISLVSGITLLAPARRVTAIPHKQTESSFSWEVQQMAQKQEVIWYRTEPIESNVVYPSPFRTDEPRVLSVNAGEVSEYELSLDASLTAIQPPIMYDILPPGGIGVSAYSVVGNDDVHVTTEAWETGGGSVTVEVGRDSRSLLVTIVGPTGIPSIAGEELTSFRLALSANSRESVYPALYVYGDGVYMEPRSIIIRTGATESETPQEFAPVIDSIFLNTVDQAYEAGTRAAARYGPTGRGRLSERITSLNSPGLDGVLTVASYLDQQIAVGDDTYGDVDTLYAGMTYAEVQTSIHESLSVDYQNQVFGNIVSARIWDWRSSNFFRVRDASTEWGENSYSAENDVIMRDLDNATLGTYGDVDSRMAARGVDYARGTRMGVGV